MDLAIIWHTCIVHNFISLIEMEPLSPILIVIIWICQILFVLDMMVISFDFYVEFTIILLNFSVCNPWVWMLS